MNVGLSFVTDQLHALLIGTEFAAEQNGRGNIEYLKQVQKI
jgi:hypothetical protein